MNLVIDIGNTIAKIAVFEEDALVEIIYDSTWDMKLWSEFIDKYDLQGGIISSVVHLPAEVIGFLDSLSFPVLYMNSLTDVPIVNLYKTPQTLGCDRLAAVVGASHFKPHCDLLVIDAGTCITYDFIDSNNNYHGGNISPGLQMRFKALHQFTGKLPLVKEEGKTPLLGEDTETAIRAGIRRGIEFEIEGYISRLRYKYPKLFVFLTGGDAFSFDGSIKNIIFADRFLVLKGLNRILNYNNGRI